MKAINLMAILIALLFVTQSCKDDDCDDPTLPYCSNYDPCLGKIETSADFYIYANIPGAIPDGWRFIDTDTIHSAQGATFKAKYKADKYIWFVGSEIIEDSMVYRVNFPPDENVTVTLIVENENPAVDCFPNDIGRDTFSRTFFCNSTVIQKPRWEGVFIGEYDFLPGEEHHFSLGIDSFFVYGLPYDECQHRIQIGPSTHSSVIFGVWDVLDQAGRCQDGYTAFMSVENDSFELEVVKSSSNPLLVNKIMRGIKN